MLHCNGVPHWLSPYQIDPCICHQQHFSISRYNLLQVKKSNLGIRQPTVDLISATGNSPLGKKHLHINTLALGDVTNFRFVNIQTNFSNSYLKYFLGNFPNMNTILLHDIAGCNQAPSHYLQHCWPSTWQNGWWTSKLKVNTTVIQ